MIASLARAVAGDDDAIAGLHAIAPEAIVEAASRHGVLALLHDALGRRAGTPEQLMDLVAARTRRDLVADLLSEAELPKALAALTAAGAQPVIIKGTHLAYSCYVRPDLRPRVDTDLFIAEDHRAAADAALTANGYERQGAMSGGLVSYQSLYVKRVAGAPVSALDVHWKISNAQMFAGILEHREAREHSVALPRLGPDARGLSNVHALLLACVHRLAHHRDGDRLIWLYDIRLLTARLTHEEWSSFVETAIERRMVGVCQRSLERADQSFPPVRIPPHAAVRPEWVNPKREPSAGYLAPRRAVHGIADDLRALPRWRERWQLLREHLFPPAHYMRTVYAPASRAPLALLHVRRLLFGARKWLGAAR